MVRTLLLVPTGVGVGLSTVSLGLERAFEEQGLRVKRFKPVEQNKKSTQTKGGTVSFQQVQQFLSEGSEDRLLEEILVNFNKICEDVDVVLVQGLIAFQDQAYANTVNQGLASTLDAKIVIVTAPGDYSSQALEGQVDIAVRALTNGESQRVLGCIINKVNGPTVKDVDARLDLGHFYPPANECADAKMLYQSFRLPVLACIPWNPRVIEPRVKDVALFLDAKVLDEGDMESRRVQFITLCARSVNNVVPSLQPGTLIITPGDRSDIIVATCLAALNGVKIAGLVLTGNFPPDENIMQLCQQGIRTGLPILSVEENSFRTAVSLHHLNNEVPDDDIERIEMVKNFVAMHLLRDWMMAFVNDQEERRMSPVAFRYKISELARAANKKIVLPEGAEPRTIAAAAICSQQGLAHCVLLGNTEEIHRVAQNNGITLSSNMIILDPALIASQYVDVLTEIRQEKGMTKILAVEYLRDPVVVGTMMLYNNEVDGLVSGALHTTANTVRPALQIIKTAPGTSLVSSVFFMCMPEQILVFADCAINPNPDAQALAQIAIQSADTAKTFGITPRVAMISYSTGDSGEGQDVDKVRAATELVKKLRSDIVVDGPLQYDAALIPEVAKNKAPQSPVAGKATVFIFPDLNTGNTTYKAVQRSADVLAIGPMLQGLRKPVNDLSRGATIDDIVYTIAITAIQAA